MGTYYYVLIASNLYGNSSISNCIGTGPSVRLSLQIINGIVPNPSYTGFIAALWNAPTGATRYYVFPADLNNHDRDRLEFHR